MPILLQDFAMRFDNSASRPGFAITAILTLALGVGANVVVFSVLNALILKPAERAATAEPLQHGAQGCMAWVFPIVSGLLDYRDRNSTFSGMAAYGMTECRCQHWRPATKSFGYLVSGQLLRHAGRAARAGAVLSCLSDEHGPNSAPYIVLSDNFWRRRFNGNPHIVGHERSI